MMSPHVVVSAETGQQVAPTIKSMTMISASVDAPTQSNAPVDRHLIQIPVNVSAPSRDLSALLLRNTMTLHASALASIDHRDVLILKHSIMTFVSVGAPTQSNALEDRHSIQALVNVNVHNLGLNVLAIKNTTMLLAGALVQIDHKDVPTIKRLTMILVHVNVHTQFNALVGRSLIQILVDVNVLNQHRTAQHISTLTMSIVGVPAQIDHKAVPIIKLLITILVRADAHTQSDALGGRDLIQIPADASALSQGLSVHHLKNMIL